MPTENGVPGSARRLYFRIENAVAVLGEDRVVDSLNHCINVINNNDGYKSARVWYAGLPLCNQKQALESSNGFLLLAIGRINRSSSNDYFEQHFEELDEIFTLALARTDTILEHPGNNITESDSNYLDRLIALETRCDTFLSNLNTLEAERAAVEGRHEQQLSTVLKNFDQQLESMQQGYETRIRSLQSRLNALEEQISATESSSRMRIRVLEEQISRYDPVGPSGSTSGVTSQSSPLVTIMLNSSSPSVVNPSPIEVHCNHAVKPTFTHQSPVDISITQTNQSEDPPSDGNMKRRPSAALPLDQASANNHISRPPSTSPLNPENLPSGRSSSLSFSHSQTESHHCSQATPESTVNISICRPNEKLTTPTDESFVCPTCPRRFNARGDLECHLLVYPTHVWPENQI